MLQLLQRRFLPDEVKGRDRRGRRKAGLLLQRRFVPDEERSCGRNANECVTGRKDKL
jgi:hypothetical protein